MHNASGILQLHQHLFHMPASSTTRITHVFPVRPPCQHASIALGSLVRLLSRSASPRSHHVISGAAIPGRQRRVVRPISARSHKPAASLHITGRHATRLRVAARPLRPRQPSETSAVQHPSVRSGWRQNSGQASQARSLHGANHPAPLYVAVQTPHGFCRRECERPKRGLKIDIRKFFRLSLRQSQSRALRALTSRTSRRAHSVASIR